MASKATEDAKPYVWALCLFAGFSVVAGSWLMLGYYLARKQSQQLAGLDGPQLGWEPELPPLVNDVVRSRPRWIPTPRQRELSTGLLRATVGPSPVEILGGASGGMRVATITTDQPIRVDYYQGSLTPLSGIYIHPFAPVKIRVAGDQTLYAIAATGTSADVGIHYEQV